MKTILRLRSKESTCSKQHRGEFCGMPFLEAAQLAVKEMPPTAFSVLLNYLLENGVGSENAKTWGELKKVLSRYNLSMTKRGFQTEVISTRKPTSQIFIGSGQSGYFIIKDAADAEVMATFYRGRIASESGHLKHLIDLMTQTGWETGPS